MELAPSPQVAGRARRALRMILAPMPEEIKDNICLLATELIGNSLHHSRLRPGDRIGLEVEVKRDSVRVQVCDPGSGPVPSRRVAALDDLGGRGLFLVDSLAHKWGVKVSERTCVWFAIYLRA